MALVQSGPTLVAEFVERPPSQEMAPTRDGSGEDCRLVGRGVTSQQSENSAGGAAHGIETVVAFNLVPPNA